MRSGDQLAEAELPRLFTEFSDVDKSRRFLVVCRSRSRHRHDEFLPANSKCAWFFNIKSVDEIDAPERADLGIVLNQIEHMRRTDAMHLLSRMRDQYCHRVLVSITRKIFSERELLALGYIKQKHPSPDGHFYLHDPDFFFERREQSMPYSQAYTDDIKIDRW